MKKINEYEIIEKIVKVYSAKKQDMLLPKEEKPYFIIDLADFDKVKGKCWTKVANKQWMRFKGVFLSREIAMAKKKQYVNYINNNEDDNTQANLQITTRSNIGANRRLNKNNLSGRKGVRYDKDVGAYSAYITKDQKKYHLGFFDDMEVASAVYNKFAELLFGKFARKNKRNNKMQVEEKELFDNCTLVLNVRVPKTAQIKSVKQRSIHDIYR